MRKAICKPEKPIRFRRLMDDGGMLLVNLAKGRLGADISNLLGGLIFSGIVSAACRRLNQPEETRQPFVLNADEFHSFTSSALAGMLPELRKYGLGLTLTTHFSQIELETREAILGMSERSSAACAAAGGYRRSTRRGRHRSPLRVLGVRRDIAPGRANCGTPGRPDHRAPGEQSRRPAWKHRGGWQDRSGRSNSLLANSVAYDSIQGRLSRRSWKIATRLSPGKACRSSKINFAARKKAAPLRQSSFSASSRNASGTERGPSSATEA
jgi:hypothetical protein